MTSLFLDAVASRIFTLGANAATRDTPKPFVPHASDNHRPRRPPELWPPRPALPAEFAAPRAAAPRADDIELAADWRATLELRPAEVAEKRLRPLLPEDRAEGDGGAGRGAAERALVPGPDPNERIDDARDSTAERGEDERMAARAAADEALLPEGDPNERIDDPRDSTAERGEDDRMAARAAADGAGLEFIALDPNV